MSESSTGVIDVKEQLHFVIEKNGGKNETKNCIC